VKLAGTDEWSSDVVAVSGPGVFAVATVSDQGVVALLSGSESIKYRCVMPLVS
jgi:hypothetical protein